MSFRLKTIVGVALIEAVLLAILVASMLGYLKTSNQDELQRRATTTAALFASMAKTAVISTDLASLEIFVTQLVENSGMEYVRVRDDQNRVLAEGGPRDLLARPFQADATVAEAADGVFDTAIDVVEGGHTFGRVEIGLSVRHLESLIDNARRATTAIAISEMALVALFSFFLGLYLTRQLHGLKAASDRITEGEIGYQIDVKGRDEIAQTAIAFNRMSSRLREVYERLSDSEARLRTVLDTVIDAIVTIDEHGIIQAANPAAEQMFGYAVHEMVGNNVRMLVPEPHRSAHDGYIAAYLQTGKGKIIGRIREVSGRRSDGSEFPMELSIGETCLDNGRLFSGVMRDITRRKRLEALKAEFVSTVSHELRTPLTSIHGSIGLVASGKLMPLTPEGSRLLEIAHNNTGRLVNLINDILDIEKLDSGRMEMRFRDVNLSGLVKHALETNAAYAAQRGIRLMPADLPDVMVRVDPDRISQVLMNLLSNAIKFSPDGGNVSVGLAIQGKHARVTVSDHGPGIPVDFRPRVFERFAQADGSSTRAKGGTGLGLSICKAIIDRHGGHIGFDTEIGRGTDFWFELDLADVPAEVGVSA